MIGAPVVRTADTFSRGLVCKACGGRQWWVRYTRIKLGGVIQRRRECRGCGRRITTWERQVG
jgi:transcriptional regulator NrdR family protein